MPLYPRRWLLVLLALATTVLLAPRSSPEAATPAPASVNCVYLPLVSTSQLVERSAQQPAGIAATGCPPNPAPSPEPSPEPSPAPAPPPISGAVQVLPEHRVVTQTSQPLQIVVVLDQSGSMSANFKGQCDNNNPPAQSFIGEPARFWQCSGYPLYDTDGDGVGDTHPPANTLVTGVGMSYHWSNQSERRITVAKRAVETLIKLTNMPGSANYTPLYPSDQMALVWFTEGAQRNGNNEIFSNGTPFTDSSPELIAKMWARSTHPSGDVNLTTGGTNATAGLYRAGMLLDSAPSEVVHTDGQTYRYRRIVLLITDGITNQFFHESQSNLRVRQSDASTYPPGHACRALGAWAIEDADCQTTGVGGVYTTTLTIDGHNHQVVLDRPMTQMALVSREILQRNGDEVHVLALGDVPAAVMGQVASSEQYLRHIARLILNPDGSSNVDQAISDIPNRLIEEQCQGAVAPAWVTSMATQSRPDAPPLSFPNVGEVRLSDEAAGLSFTVPIVVAEPDGAMSYTVAGVPPGTYELTARLWYRGDDGVTRVYPLLDEGGQPAGAISVTLTGAEAELPTLSLRLGDNVCATP